MVRLIFIIVALLVLIGAGVGGMYAVGIDPLVKLGITQPAPAKDIPPPPPPPPSYVEFGVLIVPLIQDHEVKKQAEMIVRLEVDPKNKDIVARNLPRLQNAFLENMIGFLSVTAREGQPLDMPAIQRHLVAVADKAIGAGFIKDISVENAALK